MTTRIDLKSAENPREIVVDVVARLAGGEIGQLTIDSGHILVAWSQRPDAVQRLSQLLSEDESLALAVTSSHQAVDFLDSPSALARRLMTRCWPGPLEIRFVAGQMGGLFTALPDEVREGLIQHQSVGLLCPKSPVLREIQRLLSGPVVLTSPLANDKLCGLIARNSSAERNCVVDLILEGDPPRFAAGPTIIAMEEDGWKVIQAGAVPPKNLERMSGTIFLFVCTGNTCRSPMAEGLFRKLLAESLQCDADELPDRGYLILSAGISAAEGGPASPEAVQLLEDMGVDIADHTSRQLTESLLDQADHVLTMTQGHRYAILSSRPDLESKVRVLSPEGNDISDPIGGGIEDYQACKNEIEHCLRSLITTLS